MVHVLCMLDAEGYKHTLRIYLYLFLFQNNSSHLNVPHCSIIHTLLVLFILKLM